MRRETYCARTILVLSGFGLGVGVLSLHLFSLQIRRHDELKGKAQRKCIATRTVHSQRGAIRDVHGNLLAGNLACRDLLAEPWKFRHESAEVADELARVLNLDADELWLRFAFTAGRGERYPEAQLQVEVSAAAAARLMEAELPGVRVREIRSTTGGSGFAGRLQRALARIRPKPPEGHRLVLRTSSLRNPETRRQVFAALDRELDCGVHQLETWYQGATGSAGLPEEMVVAREVPVHRAEFIQTMVQVRFKPWRFDGDKEAVVPFLVSELGMDHAVFDNALATGRDPKRRHRVTLQRAVPAQAWATVEQRDIPGLYAVPHWRNIRFVDSSRRYHPKGELASNVVGFTNSSGHGVSGIEMLYDAALQPAAGHSRYLRDRRGAPLLAEPLDVDAPVPGGDVFLTISEPIQQIVEDEMRRMVERYEPKSAWAIMANPRTGALMALAQYPSFDPNREAREGELSNRQVRAAISGFEPGSVMKPLALCGAMDYGLADLNTRVYCEKGAWFYCGRILRDSHRYETLTLEEIIQHSSNIGTAKIALERMGEGRLYQTLWRYGFGQPTGIGFRAESWGIFHKPKDWNGLTVTRVPIGQGILVTPLQLVQAYCALANRGTMMQMYMVDRVRYPDGAEEKTRPEVRRRVTRPETARRVIRALKKVTQRGGTAPKAAVNGYEVAGKTGTAQKAVAGGYSSSAYVASFVGFVPADNPAFVLLVSADEPDRSKGYYGGTVAAPAFSRIAEATLRFLNIAPHTDALLVDRTTGPMGLRTADSSR